MCIRDSPKIDGATKLVLGTASGDRIETVILRSATGRVSLCVSSQVGCAVRCRFCATGQLPRVTSLAVSEILEQVMLANRVLGPERRCVRNVVFMGMGEPLHNENAVSSAVEKLRSPQHFDLAERRLCVSTVGIPEAMERFARRFPRVGLALSLHSARQDRREELIPLARRVSLARLREAMQTCTRIQQKTLMIEYLMLEGFNDTEEDLDALCRLLDGIPVHVNLIPYNPIAGFSRYPATTKEGREQFGAALRERGHVVTLRYSMGADIDAACGQLVLKSGTQRR